MNQIGPYIVEAELGRGAMGIVYRARDPLIGREVAVKVVNLAAASGPHEQQMLRDRMIREAMAAGTLSHPGIVTVYHAGELPWGVFIAMELVDGQPLDRLLEQDKCPRDLVLPILSQLAAALDYAHARGVIHRDVKPSNVLLGRDGRVRLCDFGIAKLLTAPSATASAGLVLGTPNYMAPEQILGEPVTAQTDQYALAVLAYELLTGQRPFVADTLPLLFRKIADDPPPPAHQIDPGLPAAVSLVLAKALSKDPQLRYPDCSRFVSALQQACIENPRWLSSGSASRSARWDAIHLDPSTGKRPPAEGPIAAGASQATPDSAGHDLLGPRSDESPSREQRTRPLHWLGHCLRKAAAGRGKLLSSQDEEAPWWLFSPWLSSPFWFWLCNLPARANRPAHGGRWNGEDWIPDDSARGRGTRQVALAARRPLRSACPGGRVRPLIACGASRRRKRLVPICGNVGVEGEPAGANFPLADVSRQSGAHRSGAGRRSSTARPSVVCRTDRPREDIAPGGLEWHRVCRHFRRASLGCDGRQDSVEQVRRVNRRRWPGGATGRRRLCISCCRSGCLL
jgi:serine/threonine protein kinase